MSTANREELGGVAEWASNLLSRFVATTLVFGIIGLGASLPALLILPQFGALEAAFGWLAVVGVIIPMYDPDFSEEDSETFESVFDTYQELNRFEKILAIASFFIILFGALSSVVFVTGIVAAYLSVWSNAGIVGISIAVLYPSVDTWIGQKIRWNIASIGGILGVAIVLLAALLYRANTSVPRSVASDMRKEFILGR